MRQSLEKSFEEVVDLIRQARQRTWQAVNTALVELYWQAGEHISRKVDEAAWGEGVIDDLARYISERHPDWEGFTRASPLQDEAAIRDVSRRRKRVTTGEVRV